MRLASLAVVTLCISGCRRVPAPTQGNATSRPTLVIPYAVAVGIPAPQPAQSGDDEAERLRSDSANRLLCAGDAAMWARLDALLAATKDNLKARLIGSRLNCPPMRSYCTAISNRLETSSKRPELQEIWWMELSHCGDRFAALFERDASDDILIGYHTASPRPWSERLAKLATTGAPLQAVAADQLVNALTISHDPRAAEILRQRNTPKVVGTGDQPDDPARRRELAAFVGKRWGEGEMDDREPFLAELTLFGYLESEDRAHWFDLHFSRFEQEAELFDSLRRMVRPALDRAYVDMVKRPTQELQVYVDGKQWKWTPHLQRVSDRVPPPFDQRNPPVYDYVDLVGFTNTLLRSQGAKQRCIAVRNAPQYFGLVCGPEAVLVEAVSLRRLDAQ